MDNPSAEYQLRFWKRLQETVISHAHLTPPKTVWKDLSDSVNEYREQRINTLQKRMFTGFGASIAVLVFIILWSLVQPGVRLLWSVHGPIPAEFRIYRAPLGSESFILIRELRAHGDIQLYHYTDIFIIPGSIYTYRVEVLDERGSVGFSQLIVEDTWYALPWQLSILLTSVIIGLATYALFNVLRTGLKLNFNSVNFY